jgi:ribosomal protein L40E
MEIIFQDLFDIYVVGAFVGLFVAFDLELTFLPPIMILFEVNNNLEKINAKLDRMNYQSVNVPSSSVNTMSLAAKDYIENINKEKAQENLRDIWVCKKCGEENPTTKNYCSSCGEYR